MQALRSPRRPSGSPGACRRSRPQISIVVVSYDCWPLLRECLESVARNGESLGCEVVVVDNGSRDGTCESLREVFPECRIVPNTANLGFARACNQGMRTALGAYVLLLNPDTIVFPGTLRKTYRYMEATPHLAAAGCKVLLPDGTIDPSCKRNFPSPWDAFCRMVGLSRVFPRSRVFARYDSRYLDENCRQEVPLIDACYMMIRRAALDDVGGFDERFFMYAEEMDWCKRAREKGWAIGYDPSGAIMHRKGETTRRCPFRMLYHFHRSMALYYRKHFSPWNPACLIVYPGILLRFVLLTVWNLVRTERRVSG